MIKAIYLKAKCDVFRQILTNCAPHKELLIEDKSDGSGQLEVQHSGRLGGKLKSILFIRHLHSEHQAFIHDDLVT